MRVELIYFDAGGGHRSAAQALLAGLAQQQPSWDVQALNFFALIDPQGAFPRITGIEPEAYYNRRLKSGWTIGLAQELKVLQRLIRAAHAPLVRRLTEHWHRSRPDLVVSLIPNFNRALADSVAVALPGVPFVTVMTDLADLPPAFWIEPGSAQHVVCGSARALAQAHAASVPGERIHAVSGMLLRPDFHADADARDRAAARAAIGLDAATPTGLVLFGGHGSAAMRSIERLLPDVPLILLCGRNDALRSALQAVRAPAPRVVVGHTDAVARLMRLADFFIGKPGPGSISEALHCGLPVIVSRNAWTMPQERYNADWVLEQGVGRVVARNSEVPAAVQSLLADLPLLQRRVAGLRNRALFEVPALLQRIVESRNRRGGVIAPLPCAPTMPAHAA